jgi:tetratricopeptide (TPR) repeat protein
MEQTSLFEEPYTLLNSGVAALKSLRMTEAQEKFREYGELCRDFGTVDVYLKLAKFLHDGLAGIDREATDAPVRLWRQWKAFESYAATMKLPGADLLSDLQSVYFSMAITVMETLGMAEASWFDEGLPTGLLYLEAGACDRAIASLQACIPKSANNASVYGYLGDAYLLRGDIEVARRCYLEACLVNPAGINWGHVKDDVLLSLLATLRDKYPEVGNKGDGIVAKSNLQEEASGNGPGEDEVIPLVLAWLPAHAYTAGLFKPKIIRLKDEFTAFVGDFQVLEKRYRRDTKSCVSTQIAAALFFRAIILCDNEASLRLVKGMDFADIRRQMKEIHPELFANYLQVIKERKKTMK